MIDDTLIEDLVRAGVPPDLIGRVVRVLVVHGSHRTSAEQVDARRMRDRERKRVEREELRKIKELAKANDVANKNDVPRTSADSDVVCTNVLSKKVDSNKGSKESKKVSTELNSTELPSTVHRARARGTRIPADWRPSADAVTWCRSYGVIGSQLEIMISEFIDYWVAIPGQRGCKMGALGWDSTFRNRVRQKVPTPRLLTAIEPTFKTPPPEFLERERQRNAAKGTGVRSNANVGNNGAGHAPELCLSGGGVLRAEVSGAQGDAPDAHHAKR
jgi:hypothetical protein